MICLRSGWLVRFGTALIPADSDGSVGVQNAWPLPFLTFFKDVK